MTVIDDYLAKVEKSQRQELERIRQIIKKAVPDAVEVISYGMPGFKYKDRYLISFAPFKDHMSIFPGSAPVEYFKKELSGYKLSKGTIQFTIDKPLPGDIIKAIIFKCVSVINEG